MSITISLRRTALCGWLALALAAAGPSVYAQQRDAAKEKELIALLTNEATPGGEKALACKKLALDGGPDCVAVLAPLLADEKMSSWARIALEAIPGPEAAAILREASTSLKGRLLIGTVNSIGVRRDADSVAALGKLLNDEDIEVVGAAALALGRIGDAESEKLVRGKLASGTAAVKSAVAEGCILCAERRLNAGDAGPAAEIYDEVRTAQVSKPRVLEATRGAILARTGDAVPLLIEQLNSSDVAFQRLGLTVAREMSGPQVTEALTAQLKQAKPEMAAMLLIALADRGDKSALPVVLEVAKSGNDSVRLAAAEVLLTLGDASWIPTLIDLAQQSNKDVADAATATLAGLQGEAINQAITSRLESATGKTQRLLIDLIGQRRMKAVDALRKAIDSSDESVRHAALAALGETIEPSDMRLLINRLSDGKYPTDLAVVQQSLRAAAVRMEDREAVAAQLSDSIADQPNSVKSKLLEILAEVGGTNALQAMKRAAMSNDNALRDTSSRLLGNWFDVEAGPVLFELAQMPTSIYTTRAVRGYIRLARQFTMSDQQRSEMCRQAMKIAKFAPEQKLVVEVMERYPSLGMMDVAVEAKPLPAASEDFKRAVMMIAAKLPDSDEVKSRLAKVGHKPVKVEIVKAEYGSSDTKRDVSDVLRKQVRDLPVIPLPG
ncbi:MAG: HEAT repeat domain-containing protein, partial [Pirellulaceae bacterium]|nr:HEAT repeat domain-containing protein [Pirellulaceae bacterium]